MRGCGLRRADNPVDRTDVALASRDEPPISVPLEGMGVDCRLCAIPAVVLLIDRLNPRQKFGAIAAWLLIGIIVLAKNLRSK